MTCCVSQNSTALAADLPYYFDDAILVGVRHPHRRWQRQRIAVNRLGNGKRLGTPSRVCETQVIWLPNVATGHTTVDQPMTKLSARHSESVLFDENRVQPERAEGPGRLFHQAKPRNIAEGLGVALGDRAFFRHKSIELLELGAPDGGVEIGHSVVVTNFVVNIVGSQASSGRKVLCPGSQAGITGHDRTASASRNNLVPVETKTAQMAVGAQLRVVASCAERFRRVFDHGQAELVCLASVWPADHRGDRAGEPVAMP